MCRIGSDKESLAGVADVGYGDHDKSYTLNRMRTTVRMVVVAIALLLLTMVGSIITTEPVSYNLTLLVPLVLPLSALVLLLLFLCLLQRRKTLVVSISS